MNVSVVQSVQIMDRREAQMLAALEPQADVMRRYSALYKTSSVTDGSCHLVQVP